MRQASIYWHNFHIIWLFLTIFLAILFQSIFAKFKIGHFTWSNCLYPAQKRKVNSGVIFCNGRWNLGQLYGSQQQRHLLRARARASSAGVNTAGHVRVIKRDHNLHQLPLFIDIIKFTLARKTKWFFLGQKQAFLFWLPAFHHVVSAWHIICCDSWLVFLQKSHEECLNHCFILDNTVNSWKL